MGDAKLGVSLDQSFIQHLLLLVAHIRNQKGEENHQLLDLLCQHGVDVAVIQFINQFHLRGDSGPYLHHIDASSGARGQFNIGAANFVAGPLEFMAL